MLLCRLITIFQVHSAVDICILKGFLWLQARCLLRSHGSQMLLWNACSCVTSCHMDHGWCYGREPLPVSVALCLLVFDCG